MPHFDRLRNTLAWRDIPGCPGRSVLAGDNTDLDQAMRRWGRRFELESARDPVWLLLTDEGDGALLAYEKPGGTFVHTLNTKSALERKCTQLGLDLERFHRDLDEGVEVDEPWDLVVEDFGADRAWALRLIRKRSDLTLVAAAAAMARPPLRLRVGLWRPQAEALLATLRERGGDGRLVTSA